MFLATSSSTVGWLLSCAKIFGAMSAARMREITKRRCICSLRDTYQTAKRNGYSKDFAKQVAAGFLNGLECSIRCAVPESDQRMRRVALGANMRSTLSSRVKALSRQAAPDCAPKRHKAATQLNDRARTLRQFRSPAR